MSHFVRASLTALLGASLGCSSAAPSTADGEETDAATPAQAVTPGATSSVTADGGEAASPSSADAGTGTGVADGGAPLVNPKYLSALGARCDGSDDSAAVAAAVTGARNAAYTLVVDCPATLDIGLNIDRSIFIDNGTTVVFQGTGKFTINNLFEPAFVIADTSDVTLTNWNVEWNNSMPVSLNTDGYSLGGTYHSTPGENGSGFFSDEILTGWLEKNRNVTFPDGPTHGKWALWVGSVNVGAIFFIVGDTKNVQISGLDLHSANPAQPSAYIPFGFMFGLQYRSNQAVTTATPAPTATNASQFYAAPTGLTFDHVALDGIIMGFQGNTIDSTFSNITVEHVSDLQDADGGTIGGVGQNFPPPHLFYLNYEYGGDPALFNSGIKIENVDEVGPRLGGVRPGGGGYADSLKLGCVSCSVNGYTTNRKDGFMDVLDSDGLTVTNVTASYDSSFVDQYEDWPGWRWPGGGSPVVFKNVSFSNVTLTDLAATTVAGPLGNNTAAGNENLTMTNVNIVVQSWTQGKITPTWTGLSAGSEVTFTLKKQGTTQVLKP